MLVPLAVLASLLFVFVAEGAAGASVVDRYMIGALVVMLIFCAAGGRRLVDARARHGLRRVWIAWCRRARALRRRLRRNDAQPHEPAHHARLPRGLPRGARRGAAQPGGQSRAEALSAALAAQQQADPRRALDPRQHRPARHRGPQPGERRRPQGRVCSSSDRIQRGSVAVYPLGEAVFVEAIVDVGDDPRDQVPARGFKRVYTSRYYAVYANC